MCKKDHKYEVSCSVLEGFECCKCCGILQCEYDICPPAEKIIKGKEKTVYEYREMCELNYILGNVYNAKNAFIEGRFHKRYYERANSAQEELLKLRKEISEDEKIRPYFKKDMLNRIRYGIASYNQLLYCMITKRAKIIKDDKCMNLNKKTTFYHIKKYLNKFTAKSIGDNRILCKAEKVILLKKKGIENPLPLIKY